MLGNPTGHWKTERRELVRGRILETAWALAREHGLSGFTLREVAREVGMQAPSLYTHFDSRNAIIDAMFAQAWRECLAAMETGVPEDPTGDAREWLRTVAHIYFDFCVSDPTRNQLMNARAVPDFVPSAEAYAPAVDVLERFKAAAAAHGVTRDEDVDLWTALLSGLVDAQLANDPGGDRWARLLDRAVDMYADNLDL
ncbi:TetR/AcrR family transcriptional regulator [Kocuria sp. M1R5S2]|uniref:TetR/AcrR family transcriptional regulator n=1 Tax=Kocuria rhizosphaerae TaxID=3376285 RepID=UPI0037B8BF71